MVDICGSAIETMVFSVTVWDMNGKMFLKYTPKIQNLRGTNPYLGVPYTSNNGVDGLLVPDLLLVTILRQ